MKFEREKDIPAFRGKTWKQRIELRNQARERDPAITRLQYLMATFAIPILALSQLLTQRYASLLLFVVVYVVLVGAFFMVFHSLLITPRIRRAFETDAKPSA